MHVVGFGLGVWRVLSNQHQIFMDVFDEVLQVKNLLFYVYGYTARRAEKKGTNTADTCGK